MRKEIEEKSYDDENQRTRDLNMNEIEMQDYRDLISEYRNELSKLSKDVSNKTREQKDDERRMSSQKQWKMLKIIQIWLLGYSCFDFVCQIIYQLPVFEDNVTLENIGIRKVW